MLAHKEQILLAAGGRPKCERQTVEVDLTFSWQKTLLEGGFVPDNRSIWLLEGLLFYLPNDKTKQILDGVTSLAASGSWLGFDVINSVMLTFPLTRSWVEMQAEAGAPWIGTMDDPVGFLAERGWLADLTQAGAEVANCGRWPFSVIPPTMADMPHNWFVTVRREN